MTASTVAAPPALYRFFGQILKALFIGGGVLFLAGISHSVWLAGHSPAAPDAVTGHVFRQDQHGHTYYVEAWQHWLSVGLIWIGWGVGFASGILYKTLYENVWWQRRTPFFGS